MNRRDVIAGGFAALALPTAGRALSADTARAMVGDLVTDVNAVIASGASEDAMIAEFARVFDRYSDVATIARYCLGVDARDKSAVQMSRFTDAFRGYIARKYGRRFREFIGGEITVEEAAPLKSWISVQTTVRLRGRAPLRMDFHVSDRSGQHRFFNFIIEGVNMLLTERAEIGAILDREGGNFDALIDALKG
jgi:phospholipid transport system substrate-binding protein